MNDFYWIYEFITDELNMVQLTKIIIMCVVTIVGIVGLYRIISLLEEISSKL